MELQSKSDTDDFNRATLTLHYIATGLVRSFRHAEKHGGVWFPYQRTLETGLNRLLLAAIEQTASAPASVPELVSWCHRPLHTWGMAYDNDATGVEILLKHGTPTAFCEQLACLVSDVEADLTEQRVMNDVLARCKDANVPQTYVAFRKLLIDRPTLSTVEFLEQSTLPELLQLRDQLEEVYEAVPAALVFDDGTIRTCERCGNPLVPLQNGESRCEETDCDTGEPARTNRTLTTADRPLRIKRGLRLFVTAPGRAETRLAASLEKRGLAVELWPAFDNYDLRLTFPGGAVWAVDVKDWQNPYHLAQKLGQQGTSIRNAPPWQQGFFVFPNRRKDEWPDYKRVVQNRCRFPKKHISLF